MKAILLAAGKGERLGEVTQKIPKPMLKVHGKPILESNIEWLKNYGIDEIYINLHHLPEVIRNYFGDGGKWQVKVRYSFEPELLGTAGAISKIVRDFSPTNREPFLVIYSDNLLQYDLHKVINFHNKKRGIATIVVYEKEDVSQSGIVVMEREGRITRFIEKPNVNEIVSHLVNTGIYVLEKSISNYIPPEQTLDFGKDIFPQMLCKGEKIYGLIGEGSLVAIDTPQLLLNVNPDCTT